MNDLDPTDVPKIQKPDVRVRKPRKNDIHWFNPCGNQTTHFVGCIKSFNVENFCCNHKKTRITFDVKRTICILFANEGKTQVRVVVILRWKVQRWGIVNNVPLNGSPCHVFYFDKMTMKSPCWEVWKKYDGDEHA